MIVVHSYCNLFCPNVEWPFFLSLLTYFCIKVEEYFKSKGENCSVKFIG